jgi:3-oxoacyl-[acyl-carrier-protein] synthase-3
MQWNKDEVGFYALHQANAFMVNYIRKKLKVDTNLVPTNVRYYGNTGPATLPLLFSDLCCDNAYDLSKVVMSGFGVGLSWGSVATNMCETRFYKPLDK